MDSVTQAVLGASICGATLGRFHGRKAIVAGALLATLPDLDVFLSYPDPITSMTSHRGFSHSLFVLTAAALLLSWLWRVARPDPRYQGIRLFVAVWLALITHPLLDAFTSYGTQLLWPTAATPASWSSIFIIDPLYTLPLLIATLIGLWVGVRPLGAKVCQWALLLSSLYLASSVGAKYWAEQQAQQVLGRAGLHAERVFSAPQPLSILLWRVIARTDTGQDCEIQIGLLDKLRAAGTPTEFLCLPHQMHWLNALPETPELDRLRWFSNDWLRYDLIDDLLIASDLRMGIGPGQYSFRFVVAERNVDDSLSYVLPYRWFDTDYTLKEQLIPVLRRILSPTPSLPWQQWSQKLQQQLTTEAIRQ
ncbi:metal-dependent hydrolase [Alcaligenes endophyticus]|uniref:Metal-dependent hydrolase n=1 Tax=Alcaligenes endophyticus TaxID=1929088 RepID=A0ABT8EMC2_9BURK|nr:metal-dependent hydrolase [Alcaligenes endophyticus]MCX5590999.1 metal-dependent hydrolase [Alcaligenes endophyticus]MDN4122424.1 metal-dependent hydrolase [Alcaligenes endophyticus]